MGGELIRSSLGRLSEFSRWNKGRYKRGKRDGNLNKSTFFEFRSSLVVPWFFFGSSLVFNSALKYKVQRNRILRKVLFRAQIHTANYRRAHDRLWERKNNSNTILQSDTSRVCLLFFRTGCLAEHGRAWSIQGLVCRQKSR